MAQTLHSCTISPFRPPGEPSPISQRGEKTKKYGANAPQLHHILYLSRTNPGDAKKYGANAPQLHHIFPVANQPDNQGFSKVAQPAHRNRHHCKGGGSGVGRWDPCGRPSSPLFEKPLPGNPPQLALPGAFCYTLVYTRINLFLLFSELPILPKQEKESNQWRPGGKEL